MFVTIIAALALQAATHQTPEPVYFDKSAKVLIEELAQDCVRRSGIVMDRTREGLTCKHDYTSPFAQMVSLTHSVSETLNGNAPQVHDRIAYILSVYVVSEDDEGAVVTAGSQVYSPYVGINGNRVRPAPTKDGFENAVAVLKRLGGY
ncbi:hypothetical protein V8F63_14190 [Brevundimonas sp. LF-1]|uniref:hypothetical protein n=1 Tax=Brevundimonas sp. LF-1 TaxID=3126100 RepID=UPI0030DFDEF0